MPRAVSASMIKNTSKGNKGRIAITKVRTGSSKPTIKVTKKK